MKKYLVYSSLSTLLVITTLNAHAEERAGTLSITFNHCTEFVGIAPIDKTRAQALIPVAYQLVTDEAGAKIVVRVADCKQISIDDQPAKSGTVAQIGLMLISPDGTATDPNTSINNYTLSYSSNLPSVVSGLRKLGIPAVLDIGMAYEFSPATGPSDFYAAIAPSSGRSPRWFLDGTVTHPQIPFTFLANWWHQSRNGEAKMSTTFPVINFDFTSKVTFHTSRNNLIGQLLGSNRIDNFPLSFRGQYASAQMTVTLAP